MKIKYIIILLSQLLLCSCDPISQYIVTAKNKSLILVTYPPLDSLYCNKKNYSEKCEEISRHHTDEKNSYFISKGESIQIFSALGGRTSINEFPFDSIKIFKNNEVILYKGKKQILANFKQNMKSLKITYEMIP